MTIKEALFEIKEGLWALASHVLGGIFMGFIIACVFANPNVFMEFWIAGAFVFTLFGHLWIR